ncbi:MAG: putative metal-binding motif-containing protein [Myxococcota bacterium]
MRLVLGAAWVLMGSILASGCTILSSANDDDIRCAVTGDYDPCRSIDRFCVNGRCVLEPADAATTPDSNSDGDCIPSDEICNGIDDDCDTTVDEGHDLDNDGFTWCGGGVRELQDCNDESPNARPAADGNPAPPEICDGQDNDCNGMIDDAVVGCDAPNECRAGSCIDPLDCSQDGVTCESGQACNFERTPPRCEVVANGCSATGCTAPQVCDTVREMCVTPVGLGETCTTSFDCEAGAFCGIQGIIGKEPLADRICIRACCNDNDCAGASVCYAAPFGGKFCVNPADVGLPMPGTGGGAASCTTAEQCVSSICGGNCLAHCSSTNASCMSNQVCRASTNPMTSELVLACEDAPTLAFDNGEGCCAGFACDGAVCKSNLCEPNARRCTGGCRGQSDCDYGSGSWYCGYGRSESSPRFIQICRNRNHTGTSRTGDSCTASIDCRDLACINERCADNCCADTCSGDNVCTAVFVDDNHFRTYCLPRR